MRGGCVVWASARVTTRAIYGKRASHVASTEKSDMKISQVDGYLNGAFWRTKRRPQTKEISFQFFVGSSPDPSSEKMKGKDISLVVGRAVASSEARQTPMRSQKYKATTRSARCSYGLFSKWVRARANISSRDIVKPPHINVVVLLYAGKQSLPASRDPTRKYAGSIFP
jgi:hypothetical protein